MAKRKKSRKGKKRVKVKGHHRTFKGKKVYVMPHGRTVKVAKHRKGKSKAKYDARFKALPAGHRIARSGKHYYENRKNRSDTAGGIY